MDPLELRCRDAEVEARIRAQIFRGNFALHVVNYILVFLAHASLLSFHSEMCQQMMAHLSMNCHPLVALPLMSSPLAALALARYILHGMPDEIAAQRRGSAAAQLVADLTLLTDAIGLVSALAPHEVGFTFSTGAEVRLIRDAGSSPERLLVLTLSTAVVLCAGAFCYVSHLPSWSKRKVRRASPSTPPLPNRPPHTPPHPTLPHPHALATCRVKTRPPRLLARSSPCSWPSSLRR